MGDGRTLNGCLLFKDLLAPKYVCFNEQLVLHNFHETAVFQENVHVTTIWDGSNDG